MNYQTEIESQSQANPEMVLTELELLQVLGGGVSGVNENDAGPPPSTQQAGFWDFAVRQAITYIVKDMLFGSGVRGPTVPSDPSTGAEGAGGQGDGAGGAGGASGR
jgi:hypothetical protein